MDMTRVMQLLLADNSITVNALLFEGVLTSKTFTGPDCYRLLVKFLRELTGSNSMAISATIVLDKP